MAELKKIVKVRVEPDYPGEIFLEFESGDYIWLNLEAGMGAAKYAEIKELKPETDGERVYWSNGTVLTASEIIALLKSD
jgi:hypothetical protein